MFKQFAIVANQQRLNAITTKRLFASASSTATATPPAVLVTKPTPGNCTTRVVLNRPSKLNALNLQMVRDLVPVLGSVRPGSCLLLEGAGEKSFCAGGDVASVREEAVRGNRAGIPADFFFEEYHLNYWLSELQTKSKVTQVSIWNGICMGGGVGLSIHGSIRVATERTLFAMPEVVIGLFPDVGTTYALPQISGGKEVALYLALTGARIGPMDCLSTGLATHYVPSDRLEQLRQRLQALGSTCDYQTVSKVINEVRGDAAPPKPKGTPIHDLQESIKESFAYDSVDQIVDRLSRLSKQTNNPTQAKWAETTLQSILAGSPLAVKVSFEAMKRNATSNLKDSLTAEYRLSQRSVLGQPHSDFLEGVRAVLVDKDKPKWIHRSLSEVTPTDVEAFFAPLPSNHSRGEFGGDIKQALITTGTAGEQ